MSGPRTLPTRWHLLAPRVRWCLPGLLSLALLLGGCGGSSTTNASPTGAGSTTVASTAPLTAAVRANPATPPPPAPSTDECRNLSYADISLFSNNAKPEPCASPHTAYTFAVPTLPGNVAFKGVQVANAAVQSAAADRCRSAFVTFIGGDDASRALSRLTVTYFLSDQKGFDRGAHWIRCDVIALQSARSLGELPDKLGGFLGTAGALDKYGVCSRGVPGSAGSVLVMCTQPHTYRALAALKFGAADASYPGRGATLDAGQKRCKDVIGTALGRSGGFTYSWTYPSSDDWTSGQRFGFCWNETTR